MTEQTYNLTQTAQMIRRTTVWTRQLLLRGAFPGATKIKQGERLVWAVPLSAITAFEESNK